MIRPDTWSEDAGASAGHLIEEAWAECMIGTAGTYFSANLEIQSYRALLAFSHLELNRVTFVQVFDLTARCEAAAMKKNVFAAVIGFDESEALLPHYFFYRPGHRFFLFSSDSRSIVDFRLRAL
jgi:hypothetical protein